MRGKETPSLLGPLEELTSVIGSVDSGRPVIEVSSSNGPNRVGVSILSPGDGNTISETLCFLVKIPDDGQSPETQKFQKELQLSLSSFFPSIYIFFSRVPCCSNQRDTLLVLADWQGGLLPPGAQQSPSAYTTRNNRLLGLRQHIHARRETLLLRFQKGNLFLYRHWISFS
jgi:hypothetical protein